MQQQGNHRRAHSHSCKSSFQAFVILNIDIHLLLSYFNIHLILTLFRNNGHKQLEKPWTVKMLRPRHPNPHKVRPSTGDRETQLSTLSTSNWTCHTSKGSGWSWPLMIRRLRDAPSRTTTSNMLSSRSSRPSPRTSSSSWTLSRDNSKTLPEVTFQSLRKLSHHSLQGWNWSGLFPDILTKTS